MKIRSVANLSVLLLLIAIFPLPYGYYTFLRVAVFSTSLFLAYQSYEMKRENWSVAMVFLAMLFNPLIPIYLSREIWIPLDLLSASLFFLWGQMYKNKKVENNIVAEQILTHLKENEDIKVKYCSSCGVRINKLSNFCTECGTALKG